MTLTTVVLEGAVEIDVALPPGQFAAGLSAAIQQSMPVMTVPLIAGEWYIITHQIVAFGPKGSGNVFKVGQRAQQQHTAAKQQRSKR